VIGGQRPEPLSTILVRLIRHPRHRELRSELLKPWQQIPVMGKRAPTLPGPLPPTFTAPGEEVYVMFLDKTDKRVFNSGTSGSFQSELLCKPVMRVSHRKKTYQSSQNELPLLPL
jgi:hypothetical protein